MAFGCLEEKQKQIFPTHLKEVILMDHTAVGQRLSEFVSQSGLPAISDPITGISHNGYQQMQRIKTSADNRNSCQGREF